jgi:outer membrane protein TolC
MKTCAFLLSLVLAGCAVPYSDEPLYRPEIVERQASIAAQPNVTPTAASDATADTREALTLEQCIAMALRNHRNIRMADRRIAMQNDLLAEAWSAQLPQITAKGQYEVRDRRLTASFMDQTIALNERRGGSISAYAQLLLYDFGKTTEERRALRAQVAVSEENAEQARQDLALAVNQAYLHVLASQKLKTVVEESLRLLKVQFRAAQNFLGQGMVGKHDVLAVEVRLSERQQELIRVRHGLQLAQATLNRLMGLDLDRKTELIELTEGSMWQGNWLTALRQALQSRPDLTALRHHIESTEAQYRSLWGNLAPTIFVYGQGYYANEDSFAGQKGLSAGIAMQWSLFDGGATYQRLQRKEKEIAEARDIYAECSDDIALEVKKTYLALDESAERIPVALKGVELAAENLRLTSEQYGQGLVTSADILTEEDRLARARINYYQAIYGYHQALAEWLHALGSHPAGRTLSR